MDDSINEFHLAQEELRRVQDQALRAFPDLREKVDVHYLLHPDGSPNIEELEDAQLLLLRAALHLVESEKPSDMEWDVADVLAAVNEELRGRGL